MKTRKYIYLSLGVFFILMDILTTLLSAEEILTQVSTSPGGIGYLLGSQFLLFIGLFFIFRARKVQQKIDRKERQALLEAFDED